MTLEPKIRRIRASIFVLALCALRLGLPFPPASPQSLQATQASDASNLIRQLDAVTHPFDAGKCSEVSAAARRALGGSQDKARREAEAITARDAVEGHLARGAFWQDLRQPLRAEAEYREALELKPARVEPYFEIAEFYEKRGEAGEVEGAVKAASLMQPLDPRLDYYRGVARVLDGGPFSEAEQFLKNYLSRA